METLTKCACGRAARANGRECGACFRARLGSVSLGYTPTRSLGAGNVDTQATKRHFSRLEHYRKTRAEGIQPLSTSMKDIEMAKAASDYKGRAFDGGPLAHVPAPEVSTKTEA